MNLRTTLLVLSIFASAAVAQTIRLVPSQYPTIQAAINAASNGDTVLVAPGTYTGTVNFSGKTITVTSSGGSSVTTLTASTSSIVVTFQGGEGATTMLSGFRITGAGGGILCQNASPQITNCVITNQIKTSTAGGGGIRCTSTGTGICSPAISGCTIANNVAGFGAGVSFECSSAFFSYPTVTNCLISTNAGTSFSSGGGGIFLAGMTCSASVSGCRITGNSSFDGGGAVWTLPLASLSVTRCQIDHNTGPIAGAYVQALQASFIGCFVNQNIGPGSVLSLTNPTSNPPTATVNIQCCTVTANTDLNGIEGGITSTSGPLALTCSNSIVWGNTGINLNVMSSSVTSSVTYSDVGPGLFTGNSNVSTDPAFVDPANGDFHLTSASPCVNAGNPNPTGLPSTDIDASPRIAGGVVDLGADEVPAFSFPGTADGLDLYALIEGAGDPLASTRIATTGNLLTVRMKSSTGSLVGGLPLLAARLYFTGNSFPVPGGGIWLDSQSVIFYGALSAPPFGFPGLPAGGLQFDFTVPTGLAGQTVRMQGLVTSVNAANGIYATSNATEVTF